ncbi:hypothetical protein [Myxococcus sp. AB056]|uniref:hypothetical protein n=1 Tax=Myxococcus sp. AB056 TaxID=2562792 RepID=UPI0011470718|nr:hypothetical protein [Myxococcus sp. AB056]
MAGGGLKVGDLYVAVTASIGGAMANLGKLVKGVEDAAKAVKKKAGDVAKLGAVVAAGLAGAVAAASQSNAAMAQQVERMTALLYTLAADVGDALLPVVEQVADGVERMVARFQSLAPEVRASALDMAVWVAGAGLALGAVGKVAGVVETLAMGMGALLKVLNALNASSALASLAGAMDRVTASMGGMVASAPSVKSSLARLALSFGTLLVPLAAVAAAVTGVVLLAGSVYAAWEDSSTGLADFFRGLGARIGEWASHVVDAFSRAFSALGDFLRGIAATVLEKVASLVRGVSRILEPVARAAGFSQLADTFRDVSTITGKQLLDTLGEGAQLLWSGAKETAEAVGAAVAGAGRTLAEGAAFGLNTSLAGAKKLGADLAKALNLEHLTDRVQALLAQLTGTSAPGKARIRKPTDKAALAAAAKEEAARESALAKLQAQANEEARREYVASVRADAAAGAAAFREMRLQAEALADAARQAMEDARAALTEKFASAFGRLNGLVDTFMQGLTASGSVLGGVAAVAGDLLTQSEGFRETLAIVEGLIQRVADALGAFLVPLQPLLGAVSGIIDAVVSVLTPLFTLLGDMLRPLAPPLVLIGQVLQGLAPLLQVVGQAFLAVMAPLQLIAGPVLKALFSVLKFVGMVLLNVAKAIGSVWNAVVGAVQKVIRAISSLVDWTGFDGLEKFARSLNRLRVDTDAMGEALDVLGDTTWDSAMARAEETARVREHTQAVSRATEALTNVPSAWKRALRTFEAEDSQTGPTRPPSPTTPALPEGPREGEHAASPITSLPPHLLELLLRFFPGMRSMLPAATAQGAPVTYNIVGYDIDAAMEATRRDETLRQQRADVRNSGSRFLLTSRYSAT